jgi:hypothetical protein
MFPVKICPYLFSVAKFQYNALRIANSRGTRDVALSSISHEQKSIKTMEKICKFDYEYNNQYTKFPSIYNIASTSIIEYIEICRPF